MQDADGFVLRNEILIGRKGRNKTKAELVPIIRIEVNDKKRNKR